MVLIKPTLYSVPAFDSVNPFIFAFTVQGGSQVEANTLQIVNNSTGITVYEKTQTTFKFEHNLAPNTLTNGVYYYAKVKTRNTLGEESPYSNPIPFYCYTTPLIEFINLPVTKIITDSSFNFEFTYSQAQNEKLNSYIVNLYNNAGEILSTSGNKYVGGAIPPNVLSYQFSGFENNSSYKIEVTGITVENTIVTSGKIDFNVRYIVPNVFVLADLTNKCDEGYINIKSNIILIEGESNPSPPVYINNKKIDLRGNNSWVRWTKGYVLNGDFTLGIRGEKLSINKTNAILWNENDTQDTPNKIEITLRQGYNYNNPTLQMYVDAYIYNNTTIPYYIYSNYINIPAGLDQLFVWTRRINNIYEIKLENKGEII